MRICEVVRAGLRPLDREDAALDAVLRQKVQEALNDPSPSIPADRVFEELRAHHAERLTITGRDP